MENSKQVTPPKYDKILIGMVVLGILVIGIDYPVQQSLNGYWVHFGWYGVLPVFLLPLLMLLNKLTKGKIEAIVTHPLTHKAWRDFCSIIGVFSTCILVLIFSYLIPWVMLRVILSISHWQPGADVYFYIKLSSWSIFFAFLGSWLNNIFVKYVIYNPSDHVKLTDRLFREDLLKTIFFAVNLAAIIVSTVLKYNKQSIWGFSDSGMNPFVQSFVTFIAADRVITTYRKARVRSEN